MPIISGNVFKFPFSKSWIRPRMNCLAAPFRLLLAAGGQIVRKMTESAAAGTFGGGSLYDILECPFGSPVDKLKAAYRRLARKWHPGNSSV